MDRDAFDDTDRDADREVDAREEADARLLRAFDAENEETK